MPSRGPYGGDILLVDLKDFAIAGHAKVAGQPIEACLLSGSRVLTRDWKTGAASLGMLSVG